MAIAFRCTRCRARLHVPSRWAGGSVTCPRCETRVVVPETAPDGSPVFESREVERSLALLERPPAAVTGLAPAPPRTLRTGVTLPWWSIYAAVVGLMAVAGVAFSCGVWWGSVTGAG
jgi:hypothetical protein